MSEVQGNGRPEQKTERISDDELAYVKVIEAELQDVLKRRAHYAQHLFGKYNLGRQDQIQPDGLIVRQQKPAQPSAIVERTTPPAVVSGGGRE